MTATEELRQLLDERGVEWWAEDDLSEPAYYFVTKWFANGSEQTYEEIPAIRRRSLNAHCITPAQAIAATLDAGECEIAEHYAASARGEIGRERVKLSCGHVVERHSKFCQECGARIRKAVE